MLFNLILLPSLFLTFLINPISNLNYKHLNVEIYSVPIKLYIADTAFKHSKGLMFVKELPKDEGMIFVFNRESRPVFYNKNVRFPLTFLWVNSEGEIIDVTHLPKNTFATTKPKGNVKYVIEINRIIDDSTQLIGETLDLGL